MTDKTAMVNLTLDESAMLYHMLLWHIAEQKKPETSSIYLTEDVCAAIHRREIILLKKIRKANDELRL